MKKTYEFLFYKLYRFAVSNEKSVSVNWGFISLATIFEILHLLIFGLLLKYFKIELNLNTKLTPILFLVLGTLFNYFYFIRNKRIYKINMHFQEQKRIIWKDNLLFFGYILVLFFIMFIEILLLKN